MYVMMICCIAASVLLIVGVIKVSRLKSCLNYCCYSYQIFIHDQFWQVSGKNCGFTVVSVLHEQFIPTSKVTPLKIVYYA